MSILTANKIKEELAADKIYISDFDESNLGPNSYDLTLDEQIKVYTQVVLDPYAENRFECFTMPEEGMVFYPNQVYLLCTKEVIGSHYYVQKLCGKSSLARLGVSCNITSNMSNLGWFGKWVLEVSVTQPVRLYPGMEFCQVIFETVEGDISDTYDGQYQNQEGV